MCYYKGVKLPDKELLKLKDIEKDLSIYNLNEIVSEGFNYAPTPVITADKECTWNIKFMEWGFLPGYLKNRSAVENFRRGYTDNNGKFHPPVTTLNAIGEEILQPGKIFKDAALKRRCLFIVSGFYEWRHVHPIGKKGQPLKTAIKYPYFITTKNKKVQLIAGIWQTWTDKETGEMIDTCALLTTRANALMEQIHNTKKRMPVILTEQLAGEWISDDLPEARIAELATYQHNPEEMQAWTIQKDFRTALNPMEPFKYEGLADLQEK